MKKIEFNFDDNSFNKLFPFYILIDPNLKIIGLGKSLVKIFPYIKLNDHFTSIFEIKRPYLENPSFENILAIFDQLVVIGNTTDNIDLRGQFQQHDGAVLFVGSPWFVSMDQVREKKLALHDFAFHDPLLDLLHVLKTQEITSSELKELLIKINNQKNKLIKANKEIHDIALFPTQNPDPLLRIDFEGNLLTRNPAADLLASFTYKNKQYKVEEFFKFIINEIDFKKERWTFEVKSENKDFSFICKSLQKEGYVNIYGRDITEQKKNEAELQRLSLVASANKNGVVFTKPDGIIFWCNDAYLQITGYSKEEIIGKTPVEVGKCAFTNKEDLQKMIVPFYKGQAFDVELVHGRKDGSYFWTKTKGQPISDSKGNVIQYFAMIEDINEKKHAEFSLVESNNRLASLVFNLEVGIVLEDENSKVLLANKKFCSMLDYPEGPESLVGLNLLGKIEESKGFFKEPDWYVKKIKEILKRKKPVYNEEIQLADGRVYERSYIPIFRDHVYKGNLRSYVDITLKKKYEESLQNERNKYSNIIANMNLGLIEVDENDLITLANHSFCDMSGYSLEELIGKNASALLLTEESREMLNAKNVLRTKGVTDSYEVQIYNKKGERRHWLISGAPNYNINGEIAGSIGIHLDITEKKLQEEQLYLLSLIAEKNINAVVISDKEGKIEWVNSGFTLMSGYSLEELKGKRPGNMLQGPDTDPATISYLKEQISKGLPFECEIVNYSKNGEKYWVRIQGQALFNEKGEITRFFAIEENITDKKLLNNQKETLVISLAKSNKELEDYAQIVSHDLKSPLRSIHALLTWIKEDNDTPFNSQTKQYFSMIEGKVEKMDHLIDGILTYSKIDKGEYAEEKVDIQEIVQNIITMIHLPKNIEVRIKNRLPIIKADRYRMQQLFQNLISNAVNYIDKERGLVEIAVKNYKTYYVFSIQDNGIGIAKKNQEKIFKIFHFLTNNESSTGIGLSIVKKIVDSYDGKIWLESQEGVGTTFFIRLNK